MQPWSQPLLWKGGIRDPYFSDVVLLMGFEGTNGATSGPALLDESSHHNNSAYVGGSVSTAQFKFGASSYNMTGGNGLAFGDTPDWILAPTNTNQYTVEGWFRFSSLSTTEILLSQWRFIANSDLAFILLLGTSSANDVRWVTSYDGTTFGVDITTSGAGLATGTWYHIAVDYDGTKCRLYVNGVMLASTVPTHGAVHDSSWNFYLGQEASGTGNNFNGWMDEIRISKGIARYASDSGFAVPTAAFPRS